MSETITDEQVLKNLIGIKDDEEIQWNVFSAYFEDFVPSELNVIWEENTEFFGRTDGKVWRVSAVDNDGEEVRGVNIRIHDGVIIHAW